MTGIIGAMDTEISLLREEMEIARTETAAGMSFIQGTLRGREIVLVQCGVGKVNAAVCAQTLILRYGAERIINTGVAGALHPELRIGDLVISTDAVQHDMDVTSLGYQPGEIPGLGTVAFPADAELRRLAAAAVAGEAPEAKAFEGRVCSGDQFISDREKKQAILGSVGGFCCEMEGAAIAQVCALNRVPFVILRAISDQADEEGKISYRAFVETAARRCAAIVARMVSAL